MSLTILAVQMVRKSKILQKPDNSKPGHKFVITKQEGVRKQFLLLNGSPVLGFVNNNKKFSSCSSYTEVTADVDCKVSPLVETSLH